MNMTILPTSKEPEPCPHCEQFCGDFGPTCQEEMDAKDQTPFEIRTQGAPVMSHTYGYLTKRGDDVVAFYIDLNSRGCEVVATGSDGEHSPPLLYIGATEWASGLKPGCDPESSYTELAFPGYEGWDVFTATISKYTMAVCLTRRTL